MNFFPLPIFPEGSLTQSVITTVWIGVLVVSFFNLRLGWTSSGLVIPGYLAPLFLNKPLAAFIVIIEGVITYFVVWLLSQQAFRRVGVSGFFGRDRFFAIFLASIAVRIVMDGLLLPEIGALLVDRYHFAVDYRNNLHSFGTVIVALIANSFWKPGLVRGMGPLAVTTGITYLLVRYVLIVLTNFNIGSLQYLYEDFAMSFMSSPKVYIILVTVAFLASRMNLLYGWDYNGILLPALLALQWYQPMKIAASFVEAGVIMLGAAALLRTPMFREMSVEGARKILLFFNISFVYKFILGYALLYWFPHIQPTDFYGFGYLLPSLLAIRMFDKNIPLRVTMVTVQTSLVAAMLASIVGYSLTTLLELSNLFTSASVAERLGPVPREEQTLLELLRREKVSLYDARRPSSVQAPLPLELDRFRDGLLILRQYLRRRDAALLDRARAALRQAHYSLSLVEDRFFLLREEAPRRGWGIYVLSINDPDGLAVQVPVPLEEWGAFEAGVGVFLSLKGGVLAVSGSSIRTPGPLDVFSQRETFYHVFHRAFGRENIVEVRAYTAATLRVLRGTRIAGSELELPPTRSSLWVSAELPQGLSLKELKSLIGSYDVHWNGTTFRNIQRAAVERGFAELWLDRAACRNLLFKPLFALQELGATQDVLRIDGYLQQWLLGSKNQIAPRGSELFRAPSLEELLFFDEEVLKPLLQVIKRDYRDGVLSKLGRDSLRTVKASAGVLGYDLVLYRELSSGRDYVILTEMSSSAKRGYWGTFVFRLGPSAPVIVQIPRPLSERNSFEFGVSLYEDMGAQTLVVAGAHRYANRGGEADVVPLENRSNVFNLVSQAVLREAGSEPMAAVQCRAMSSDPAYLRDADVFVASADAMSDLSKPDPLVGLVLEALSRNRLAIDVVAGAPWTAGYEATELVTARYMEQAENKVFVSLWVSELARAAYRKQDENNLQSAEFQTAGIPTVEADLFDYLTKHGAAIQAKALPKDLRALAETYVETHDIVALWRLAEYAKGFRLTRIIDLNTKLSFLVFSADERHLPMVVNLSPRSEPRAVFLPENGKFDRALVKRYVNSGIAWLEAAGHD